MARVGLRQMYIETLTLTLLLAIFGAIASAFLIAGNLAQPLLVLAEGTRAVAEGDLSPRPIVATNDELGTLTQSFNTMTGQLFEARSAVERNRAALQSAKAHLESVLANMSAGVIVLDAEVHGGELERSGRPHPAASMSGADSASRCPTSPAWTPSPTPSRAPSRRKARSRPPAARASARHWQQQIEIPAPPAAPRDEHDITLLARGSRLPVRRRQRLHRGVRRYLGRDLGPALDRLGRGGAPPGARDQEPADADPAVGRTHADEARRAPAASADVDLLNARHRPPSSTRSTP